MSAPSPLSTEAVRAEMARRYRRVYTCYIVLAVATVVGFTPMYAWADFRLLVYVSLPVALVTLPIVIHAWRCARCGRALSREFVGPRFCSSCGAQLRA